MKYLRVIAAKTRNVQDTSPLGSTGKYTSREVNEAGGGLILAAGRVRSKGKKKKKKKHD